MRTSQFLINTQRETPADAEIISHQLMLRTNMIRKLASGIYSWMPLGLRVLRKVEAIIREEMNKAGAQELLMPNVQPAELWQESGRWQQYGPELLRINDRHQREFCFGPTHEEVITDIARDLLRSYKQLPAVFYQIQTKFRDEIRPRFGVMRGREFLMKDAYSFHSDSASLEQTYQVMFDAYSAIFARLGLKFRAVLADTGNIGGAVSHEFQVLADTGEDVLACSDNSNYAANIERAESLAPKGDREAPGDAMSEIDTPGLYTIEALEKSAGLPAKSSAKTILVTGAETPLVALILRGDHELNPIKAEKLPQVASPLQFADNETIKKHVGAAPGSIGPVNLNKEIAVIVDRDAAMMANFACGANTDDKHYINVNWQRDVPLPSIADLRNVVEGDQSPDGKGKLYFTRGIEVGHIFQLGDKYSTSMNANILSEQGKAVTMQMGCYGIGVSRIVGAAIEQSHDEKGIIWPTAIAPFQIVIIPVNLHKSYRLREVIDEIYLELVNAGYEVLLDDRKERPGVLFADHDLIGIPHRLVIGEKGIDAGTIEYKARRNNESVDLPLENYLAKLRELVV